MPNVTLTLSDYDDYDDICDILTRWQTRYVQYLANEMSVSPSNQDPQMRVYRQHLQNIGFCVAAADDDDTKGAHMHPFNDIDLKRIGYTLI